MNNQNTEKNATRESEAIEKEVTDIIEELQNKMTNLIKENREKLENIATKNEDIAKKYEELTNLDGKKVAKNILMGKKDKILEAIANANEAINQALEEINASEEIESENYTEEIVMEITESIAKSMQNAEKLSKTAEESFLKFESEKKIAQMVEKGKKVYSNSMKSAEELLKQEVLFEDLVKYEQNDTYDEIFPTVLSEMVEFIEELDKKYSKEEQEKIEAELEKTKESQICNENMEDILEKVAKKYEDEINRIKKAKNINNITDINAQEYMAYKEEQKQEVAKEIYIDGLKKSQEIAERLLNKEITYQDFMDFYRENEEHQELKEKIYGPERVAYQKAFELVDTLVDDEEILYVQAMLSITFEDVVNKYTKFAKELMAELEIDEINLATLKEEEFNKYVNADELDDEVSAETEVDFEYNILRKIPLIGKFFKNDLEKDTLEVIKEILREAEQQTEIELSFEDAKAYYDNKEFQYLKEAQNYVDKIIKENQMTPKEINRFLKGINWKKNKRKLKSLQNEVDLKFNPDVKYTDIDGKVYEGSLCKEIQGLTKPLFDEMEITEEESLSKKLFQREPKLNREMLYHYDTCQKLLKEPKTWVPGSELEKINNRIKKSQEKIKNIDDSSTEKNPKIQLSDYDLLTGSVEYMAKDLEEMCRDENGFVNIASYWKYVQELKDEKDKKTKGNSFEDLYKQAESYINLIKQGKKKMLVTRAIKRIAATGLLIGASLLASVGIIKGVSQQVAEDKAQSTEDQTPSDEPNTNTEVYGAEMVAKYYDTLEAREEAIRDFQNKLLSLGYNSDFDTKTNTITLKESINITEESSQKAVEVMEEFQNKMEDLGLHLSYDAENNTIKIQNPSEILTDEEEPKPEESDENTKENSEEMSYANIQFGDMLVLADDVNIHTNMYDAVTNENGYSAYFGEETIVSKAVFEIDGELKTVMDQELYNNLIKEGNTPKAILGTQDENSIGDANKAEGWYSINDFTGIQKDGVVRTLKR